MLLSRVKQDSQLLCCGKADPVCKSVGFTRLGIGQGEKEFPNSQSTGYGQGSDILFLLCFSRESSQVFNIASNPTVIPEVLLSVVENIRPEGVFVLICLE